ncbi:NAD P-binding protein [Gloeophyllum trabeum ATCC 11539]|uniref:NAD P-binding protein n=1 Tax=Gloeophyllum trabeum (strain ATCC 11539 / FP-39264 / Madison 617) TaxID=670483 RepID=S7RQ91_GLOTA|nr:NAD P-binding protein [Gloeophyllum trabeum ATCC 11539]EPQ55059.1 NAD P-binding protein [Gloeophyllum trabeum ATCC 11539]
MADSVLQNLTARNLFDLRGVIAVVTGGATGIGLMISTTLMANGATVYTVGPKQEELDNVAKLWNDGAGKNPNMGRMHGIAGDVRLKSEAKRLAEEVAKREEHITVLFNNAGIVQGSTTRPKAGATAADFVSAYFDHVTEEDFDNTLRTNTFGPYWLSFAFLPLLEKWKSPENQFSQRFVPQIIMTSSQTGWTKDVVLALQSFPYHFSKAAIGAATASLAHELLPLGIRVNGIAPGPFQTALSSPGTLNELGIPIRPPAHGWEGFQIPCGVSNAPSRDIGTVILMLVANWFISGETVLVDGGTLLKHPSSW